jgi:hypothetical protein
LRRGGGLRAAGAAALALLAGACGDFPDVTTVVDLRVLAVNTEPSEIILNDQDPTTNPSIVVTPLLVDPPRMDAVTWTIKACPNNAYGAAPPGDNGGAALGGGARTTVGSSECVDGDPNTWTIFSDPIAAGGSLAFTFSRDQLLAALKVDGYVDQFGNLHGGYDLGLPMNLELTVSDGVDTTVAIKRLLYWYTGPDLYWKGPLAPDQKPNVTPRIDDIEAYVDRDATSAEPIPPVMTLSADAPLTVPAGGHLWVQPIMPDGTAEPYWTTVIDRDTHLAVATHIDRERIRYAFYATAGKFESARSVSELPPGFTGTVHLESKYDAPASLDGLPLDGDGNGQVTVWITVRDERGGESWAKRQLLITP